MKTLRWYVVLGLALAGIVASTAAADLNLAVVPEEWPTALQTELVPWRESIAKRWTAFQEHKAQFQSEFAGTREDSPRAGPAKQRKAELTQELGAIRDDEERFNRRVAELRASRAAPPPTDDPDEHGRQVIDRLQRLAVELGWSAQKQASLAQSLYALSPEEAPMPDMARASWADILARRADAALLAAAAAAPGPAWSRSGQQQRFADCTIFALATAAQLPYGVVAARATKLMKEGTWRPEEERANPERVLERHGLMGGEVVMLAEIYGRSEIITPTYFAPVLQEGRPILINALGPGGTGAHEMVLTKTFSHGGDTWYEITDSYQPDGRRLYATRSEVESMLLENGVTFTPEPGTTPRLLR